MDSAPNPGVEGLTHPLTRVVLTSYSEDWDDKLKFVEHYQPLRGETGKAVQSRYCPRNCKR